MLLFHCRAQTRLGHYAALPLQSSNQAGSLCCSSTAEVNPGWLNTHSFLLLNYNQPCLPTKVPDVMWHVIPNCMHERRPVGWGWQICKQTLLRIRNLWLCGFHLCPLWKNPPPLGWAPYFLTPSPSPAEPPWRRERAASLRLLSPYRVTQHKMAPAASSSSYSPSCPPLSSACVACEPLPVGGQRVQGQHGLAPMLTRLSGPLSLQGPGDSDIIMSTRGLQLRANGNQLPKQRAHSRDVLTSRQKHWLQSRGGQSRFRK